MYHSSLACAYPASKEESGHPNGRHVQSTFDAQERCPCHVAQLNDQILVILAMISIGEHL